MAVINTNVKALFSQMALSSSGRAQTVAMQQLSTGKRINSARDDAAGMAIATRMTHQIRSLNQAVRNAGDAISMIQTAEGATNEITDMLQRMRELAIQAANDTNSNDQRSYLDLEFQQLKKQIVQISDNTEWNGFPVLNGAAGERVGERPVYKTVSVGQSDTIFVSPDPVLNAKDLSQDPPVDAVADETVYDTDGTTVLTGVSAYKVSGSLTLKADGAGGYTATFLTNDTPPKEIALTPDDTSAADGEISFNPEDGRNAEVFSYKAQYAFAQMDLATDQASLNVSVKGSIPSMAPGDLTLNGVTIRESLAKYDTVSPANNAAGSAIAKAAAINMHTAQTGVHAVVNENVMSGTAMTGTSIVTGYVTINGVASPTIATSLNDPRESRATTVRAINLISDKTGVVAIDTGEDAQGIKLVAKDGRNIELVIHTNDGTDAFAARTGVRAGVKAGTYSLESMVEKDIVVGTTLTGDLSTSGLRAGTYTNHWIGENDPRRLLPVTDPNYVSASDVMFKHPAVNSAARALVLGSDSDSETKQLRAGDLVINGIAIPGSDPSGDILTEEASLVTAKNLRSSSAIATAAAINSQYEKTGVRAVANPTITEGKHTEIDPANADSKQSIFVNGVEIQVQFGDATIESTTDRVKAVKAAMDEQFGRTGVEATVNDQGGLTLTAKDGRNVSVWFDSDQVSAKEFGLAVSETDADTAVAGVKGDAGADETYTEGDVLFSTVSLVSDKPIDIRPGINGYGSTSNFEALGFQTGTFGGVVDEAVSKMTPPRTGRLYFHVGASANQSITIDLADFGKGGPITSDITWDVDMDPLPAGAPLPDLGKDAEGNPIQTPQRSFISSKDSATSVLARLDVVMDKVNATRATMGAVMNRLDHVINNLTNVSMNMSASRSQIEDADYASASTELAKTQIMQQAATAVLAQANTSQQSVLKLLGG